MICRSFLMLVMLVMPLQGCVAQKHQESPADISAVATTTSSNVDGSALLPLPELFKRVSSSVVVIQTVEKKLSGKLKNGKAELESVYGLGSGVLISADGKIMTAAHVVHSADVVAVKFQNGEQVSARVIGSSPSADVALLQLENIPKGLQAATLGNSDQVQVGETIMVIGAPYGISKTMTVGYISGRIKPGDKPEEKQFGPQEMEVFQSDAAVNSGNSGGPMFNARGEVVGIVSSILSRSGGFEGISFAVTSNTAKKLLLDQPSYWIGVDAAILSQTMAKILNVPDGSGIIIQRVAENSLGHRLGLKPGYIQISLANQDFIAGGDIVVKVLGTPVPKDQDQLKDYLSSVRSKFRNMSRGEEFSVTVLREGKLINLKTVIN